MHSKQITIFIAGALFLAGLNACSASNESTIVGGLCTYQSYPGLARIVSNATLTQSDPACNNPSNAAKVVYDFTPDDLAARGHYLFSMQSDTGNYSIISAACVTTYGLFVDTDHLAARKEITQGTCTPVYFDIPDIHQTQCAPVCN